MSESDRIAEALERLSGSRPVQPPVWLGKRFPRGYRLPPLERRGEQAGLQETLHAMPDGKLLMICLLVSYRGNGPYNEFMTKFIHCATHFGDWIHGLHVISENKDRPGDRDYYFEAEDDAKRLGLPINLLYDENGSLSGAIEPSGSPFILMVDKKGTIQYEGWFEIADLWETIGRSTAPGLGA